MGNAKNSNEKSFGSDTTLLNTLQLDLFTEELGKSIVCELSIQTHLRTHAVISFTSKIDEKYFSHRNNSRLCGDINLASSL